MANTFMCSVEEKLAHDNKLPNLYKRYIDDTFGLVPDLTAANDFLSVLVDAHPAIQFTMPSCQQQLTLRGHVNHQDRTHLSTTKRLTTGFYSIIRAMWTTDIYKRSLIKTMLYHSKRLQSSLDLFPKECYDERRMFLKLKYPVKLIDSIFKRFHASPDQNQRCITPVDRPVLITSVRRQLNDLGKKIDRVIQPVFTSRKISEDLKAKETTPSLQKCVVYEAC